MSSTQDGTGAADAAVVFDVRTADFEARVINRSHQVPVLVDFWAPWCAPCKALGPALEQVVREQGGKVLLAKVNTDEEPALAKGFRVTGIPAVKAFHKGRLVNEFVGGRDLRFLKTFIESVLPQRGEAELSTRQIAETEKAKGVQQNAIAGKKGGKIAKDARRALEQKTGKKVITNENFLSPTKGNKKLDK
mgnify:CR=1 FL=1